MTSIIYQDRASGTMYIYRPEYPSQRSFYEQKRNERIFAALEELSHMGNINIYLYKKKRLRKIAQHLN